MKNKGKKYFLSAALLGLLPMASHAAVEATAMVSPATGPAMMDNGVIPVPNSPVSEDLHANVEATNVVAAAFSRVHHVNMMEIEMGKLAMEKGQSKIVRDYGERLMRDHQVNDRKLMAFAEDKNIPVDRSSVLSAEETAKERASSDSLRSAMLEDFDRLFLAKMVEGHAKAVQELSGAIEGMPSGAPRSYLAKVRPIISQHEKLATILLEKQSG
ncbi:MAG: DUF4142 domain-containing protein [Bacteriovoracia bacterium]